MEIGEEAFEIDRSSLVSPVSPAGLRFSLSPFFVGWRGGKGPELMSGMYGSLLIISHGVSGSRPSLSPDSLSENLVFSFSPSATLDSPLSVAAS